MEDSINDLGVVTTDKDVNDLAARHCEDAQVGNVQLLKISVVGWIAIPGSGDKGNWDSNLGWNNFIWI